MAGFDPSTATKLDTGGSNSFDPNSATPVTQGGSTLPANAGMVRLFATALGLPVDTVANAINLQIANAGVASRTTPSLITNPVGGSESIQQGFRWLAEKTGMQGLSPDNPAPQSKMGTAQYDFVSRGGVVPGGAIPAVSSMVAEKLGGPQWAGVGAMLPAAATSAVRSAVAVKPTPEQKLLTDEGVPLTSGRVLGGSAKRTEDALTSTPILGDSIKAAQTRSIEGFNAAAINRSLAPVGESLPKGVVGNKAIEWAGDKLSEKYQTLLPKMKGDLDYAPTNSLPSSPGQPAPLTLRQELNNLSQMAQSLHPSQRAQFDAILKNEVINKFTKQGKASGETIKGIEENLRIEANGYRHGDFDQRKLASAIDETRNALRRMIDNVNPQYADELKDINRGWANFKIVQRAASSTASKDGVFTPTTLHGAVRAQDRSRDHARFAEGNALMQDLSAAGKAVLPSSVPDSGTPLRGMVAYALAHPIRAAGMAAPLGAGALAYSQPGQASINSFLTVNPLTGKPDVRPLLSALLAQQQ